jgi:hypothetical protein
VFVHLFLPLPFVFLLVGEASSASGVFFFHIHVCSVDVFCLFGLCYVFCLFGLCFWFCLGFGFGFCIFFLGLEPSLTIFFSSLVTLVDPTHLTLNPTCRHLYIVCSFARHFLGGNEGIFFAHNKKNDSPTAGTYKMKRFCLQKK